MDFHFNWWVFILSIPAYFICSYLYRRIKRRMAINKLEKLAWEDVDSFVSVAENHDSWEVSPYKRMDGNWIKIRFAPGAKEAFFIRYLGPETFEKYGIEGLVNLVNAARN